jgi:hypothetical protein
MTDRQNTVLATTLAALVLGTVFFCPWRIEPRNELAWSPIYQPPLTYVRTFDPESGRGGGSRIEGPDAQIAYDVWALQVLAIGLVGGAGYRLTRHAGRTYDPPPPPASR